LYVGPPQSSPALQPTLFDQTEQEDPNHSSMI